MDGTFIHDVAEAQLVAALWSSHDDEGYALDDGGYTLADIAHASRLRLAGDAARFVALAGPYLTGLDAGQVGHDLWLTRNHHGAGFWDRGLGVTGDALTRLADSLGTVDLIVGDDGMLHAE